MTPDVPVTPPVCCHCGRLMAFVGAWPAVQDPVAWEEHWRCPEGRWVFHRSVPAPPGYRGAAPAPTAPGGSRRGRRPGGPPPRPARGRRAPAPPDPPPPRAPPPPPRRPPPRDTPVRPP